MEHDKVEELVPWTMSYRVWIHGDNFFRHSEVRKATSFYKATQEASYVLTKCENAQITKETLRIVSVTEVKEGEY